ncbi:MAG: SLBB domain-containing protein [Spirosomataceae bacterium]
MIPTSKRIGLVVSFLCFSLTAMSQVPTNFPLLPGQGFPAQNLPIQQTNGTTSTGVPRTFDANQVGTRSVELTQSDLKAIALEDSLKAVKEAELAADKAKSNLRKRIIGYSIFNDNRFENNLLTSIPTPKNYILGSGDKLSVDLYGFSQASYDVAVSPDGYISIPKAGLIYVAGQTIEVAKQKIASKLSRFFAGLSDGMSGSTLIAISLNNVRAIKVTILGEVVAPGTYTVTSLTSMLNALYTAGGPNEIGSYRNIQLVRAGRVINTLDLYEFMMKGYANSDFILQDQDVIQVNPYVSRIAAEGFTKRTGLFELLPNESLNKLIEYAGGFHQYAYTHQVKVYRVTPREYKINTVPTNEFGRFMMQNGDSLVVEKIIDRYENLVKVTGAVFRPGDYSLDESPTLLSVINSAEGLKEDAFIGRISIVRTLDDLRLTNISVNLKDIQTGKIADIPLRRLDEIIVPSVFDLTEQTYVRIQGAINNPDAEIGVELPYVKDLTIEDVIVRVGGLTEAASLSRIELVRRKRNVDPTKLEAQISDIFYFDVSPNLTVEDNGLKFRLLPFDEIFIRTSPNYSKQLFVSIEGEVLYPAPYAILKKDEKISDLILRAGGMTPLAYLEGATLLRKVKLSESELEMRRKTISDISLSGKSNVGVDIEDISNEKEEAIGIDLKRILANPGSSNDMVLQEGDIIRIPKRLETVRVQGEVLYPTSIKYSGTKLRAYISRAGGFTKRSLRGRSYVLYANGSVDRTRRFMGVNIYPRIEPGSEIIIPQKVVNTQQQISQFQNLVATLSGTLTTVVTLIVLTRSLVPATP